MPVPDVTTPATTPTAAVTPATPPVAPVTPVTPVTPGVPATAATGPLSVVGADGRISCPRCAVRYAPALTGNACPVCRVAAPGLTPRRRTVGDHAVLLVGFATMANLIVLAVLAIYLLR